MAWRSAVLRAALLAAIARQDTGTRDPDAGDAQDCVEHGFDRCLIAASGLFDRDYYRDGNRDVAESGMDPLEHYHRHGGLEGRRPSPQFDAAHYLDANPDVRQAGKNPIVHFVRYGIPENRSVQFDGELPLPDSTELDEPIASLATLHAQLEQPLIKELFRSSGMGLHDSSASDAAHAENSDSSMQEIEERLRTTELKLYAANSRRNRYEVDLDKMSQEIAKIYKEYQLKVKSAELALMEICSTRIVTNEDIRSIIRAVIE